LPPYNGQDASTWADVPITFAPTRYANHESKLTVRARAGQGTELVNVSARLSGSSLGPPTIVVTPTELEFKTDRGEPLQVGTLAFRQVTISNNGQSELTLNLGIDDTLGDYSLSPSYLAPIAPGGRAVLGVYYTPTGPSDLAHPAAPVRSADAYLRIGSNDTAHTLNTVTLKGWAKTGVSDDTLKVEMTFENSASSWSGNDFRDVDLELESPLGFACRKPYVQYAQQADGNFVAVSTRDFCGEWSGTNMEGRVSWIPGGQFEEPERVILFGLGPDLAEGGEFVARAHYKEDCANIPTGLLADILGIGTSALFGIIGIAAGVPVPIDPGQVSNLISENCWEKKSTTATVKVYVSNVEKAAAQVTLGRKGDFADVIKIRREQGEFKVLP
jgi:hypothetical protein